MHREKHRSLRPETLTAAPSPRLQGTGCAPRLWRESGHSPWGLPGQATGLKNPTWVFNCKPDSSRTAKFHEPWSLCYLWTYMNPHISFYFSKAFYYTDPNHFNWYVPLASQRLRPETQAWISIPVFLTISGLSVSPVQSTSQTYPKPTLFIYI